MCDYPIPDYSSQSDYYNYCKNFYQYYEQSQCNKCCGKKDEPIVIDAHALTARIQGSSGIPVTTNAPATQVVPFNQVILGSNNSLSGNQYVIPENGIYEFIYNVSISYHISAHDDNDPWPNINFSIVKNGTEPLVVQTLVLDSDPIDVIFTHQIVINYQGEFKQCERVGLETNVEPVDGVDVQIEINTQRSFKNIKTLSTLLTVHRVSDY